MFCQEKARAEKERRQNAALQTQTMAAEQTDSLAANDSGASPLPTHVDLAARELVPQVPPGDPLADKVISSDEEDMEDDLATPQDARLQDSGPVAKRRKRSEEYDREDEDDPLHDHGDPDYVLSDDD